MKQFKKIRQIIHHDYPSFEISIIKKIGEGDNSRAFLINKNYIFRFPKRKEVRQNLKKETVILPKIQGYFNLKIPAFEFISPKLHFVGYPCINGAFLTFELYHSLPKNCQFQIQKSLAIFLLQLHSILLPSIKDVELEVLNLKEEYTIDFKKIQKFIYPAISTEHAKLITKLYAGYLNNPENFEYTPTLIHNDLSNNHILYEISTQKVNGIIDFGDMAIGDPDYDLMFFLETFGIQFIKGILRYYQPKLFETLLKKLCFFILANKLQIILGSIHNNDQYELKESYSNLKGWIKKYKKIYTAHLAH